MWRDDVEAVLERVPFEPFRLHLASGKTLNVVRDDEGWMLKNSILITQRRKNGRRSYDVVSLLHIERIERIGDA